MTPLEALQEYFGYSEFRPLQADIVAAIRNKRDTFALLPTGAGKSLCYQLPSVLMSEGVTVVVSPLIALMKDQVDALTQVGITAAFLNSTQGADESRRVMEELENNQLRLLYVAPERLLQDGFLQMLKRRQVNFFAIDEAHCISQWGHDFRPEYRKMALLRKHFPITPMMALTATATERVKADIVTQLALKTPAVFAGSFNRPNLSYAIHQKQQGGAQLQQLLNQHRGQSGIIYCQSRKLVEEVTDNLNRAGHNALPYHAGLDDEARKANQEKYIRDEVEVMVATVAFGMGINKPDVRFVIHYNMPKSIEHYYQETGRAGRDGLPSSCYLLFSYADKILYERFIREMGDEKERMVAKQQLDLMLEFAQSAQCRRAQLLAYFGEDRQVECQNCDNCTAPREQYEATVEAQKVLSCVVRTGQRFAATHVAEVLKGSKGKKVLQFGHDQLSTYGLMNRLDVKQIKAMIYELVQQGWLVQSDDQYATIKLSAKAGEVLKGETKVWLQKQQERMAARAVFSEEASEYDFGLFDVLRGLRKEVAAEKGLPPYMIFADKTLQEMARVRPQSVNALLDVYGVGEKKAEVYGLRFIDAIEHYCEKHGLIGQKSEVKSQKSEQKTNMQSQAENSLSVEQSLSLYREGLSVAEIAKRRELKEGTIHEHLTIAYENGEQLEVDDFVSVEKQRAIAKAMEGHTTAFLGPIKRALGEDYSYDEIRWVRARVNKG